jgi:hypothetical protein
MILRGPRMGSITISKRLRIILQMPEEMASCGQLVHAELVVGPKFHHV